MSKSLLPLSPGALAVSLAAHAAAFGGLLLLGSWLGDLSPRAGDAGSGALRVSLVELGLASGPEAREPMAGPVQSGSEAPPTPPRPEADVAAAASPEADVSAVRLAASASAAPRETSASAAEPEVAPSPASEATAPAPVAPAPALVAPERPVAPGRTSRLAASAAAEAPPAVGSGGVAAFAGGVPGRIGPDWPGPGEVDRAARPRWPIRPEYPPRARRSGQESTVVVEAWVDEGGAVAFASVLRSGGSDFDASAQRAVRRSAFRPARLRGEDVASRVALRIHFELYD